MSKPYDATIKDLAAQGPADLVSCFDGPTTRPVTLLNVDLSTVTTAADVVFGVGDPMTEILHLDAQAGPSATKHLDVLAYNVLLYRTYRVAEALIFHLKHCVWKMAWPWWSGSWQSGSKATRRGTRRIGCGRRPLF